MRLKELAVNDKIVLQVSIDHQNFEFETVVALNVQGAALLTPIRVDNKVVNFSSGNVKVDLLKIREDKAPILWKRIAISTISYKNNTYYVVDCASQGIELNRRSAFRLSIGIRGVAQMGLNRKAMDVIVKDVSENGFAFVCDEETDISGMTVRVVFSDMGTNISISGIVVRKEKIDDVRVVYGCILNIKSQVLNRYINQKQREILAKHSSRSTDTRKSILLNTSDDNLKQSELVPDMDVHSYIKPTSLEELKKDERRGIFKKSKEKWN